MKKQEKSTRNKWDKETIINEIKNLSNEGVSLTSSNIQKNYMRLHSAAQTYFGSWGESVNSAGFNYADIKEPKWTAEKVVFEIKNIYNKNKTLSSSFVQRNNSDVFNAAIRIFNSWENAIIASGFEPEKVRRNTSWSSEKILTEIKRISETTSQSSALFFSTNYGSVYQAARRFFKHLNWDEIVDLAKEM